MISFFTSQTPGQKPQIKSPADAAQLLMMDMGTLEQEESFSTDDAGAADFRSYLDAHKGSLFSVLADLASASVPTRM